MSTPGTPDDRQRGRMSRSYSAQPRRTDRPNARDALPPAYGPPSGNRRTATSDVSGTPVKRVAATEGASNPAPQAFDLKFSLPEIEVKMVNASSLSDYELWIFLTSIFSSTAVGFVVAFIQSTSTPDAPANSYLTIAIVMGIATMATLWRAIRLRSSIVSEAKAISMRATEVKSD